MIDGETTSFFYFLLAILYYFLPPLLFCLYIRIISCNSITKYYFTHSYFSPWPAFRGSAMPSCFLSIVAKINE